MPQTLRFYMDDSGTRKPNHEPLEYVHGKPQPFALGGILMADEHEDAVRTAHSEFCTRWKISYPLHSVAIRHGHKKFGWLRDDPSTCAQFMEELGGFLTSIPVIGLACTIDRPGYDWRYREKYGRQQWQLCQTAFTVCVERASKIAIAQGCRLRVYPEKCSKEDDKRLKQYFQNMRSAGLPFDKMTSAIYRPLTGEELAHTLYEIDFKDKTSPLAQIADLYLWPMVQAGYREYRPFEQLMSANRIIDCVLSPEERVERGLKYSCFELVKRGQAEPAPETTKAQTATV